MNLDLLKYLLVTDALAIAEIIPFVVIYGFSLKRQKHFVLRLLVTFVLLACIFFGFYYVIRMVIEPENNIALTTNVDILYNVVYYFLFFGIFFFIFKEQFNTICFSSVAASISHLLFTSFYNLILTIVSNEYLWYVYCFSLVFICGLALLLAIPLSKFDKKLYKNLNRYILFIFPLTCLLILFFESNTKMYEGQSQWIKMSVYIVEIMIFAILLVVQRLMLFWAKDMAERKALENFEVYYKDQSKQIEKNMELINIKIHDIKHHVSDIMTQKELNADMTKELTQAISLYDTHMQTGNSILDLLLQHKSLECEVNNIQITVMLDGAPLSFLPPSDIETLFGNALDNAVEHEKKEKEENRFIRVLSKKQGSFYSIVIENYCSNQISYDQRGFPITDKKDKDQHGFGVKSMAQTVKNHSGTISFLQENNLFTLTILFNLTSPIQIKN